MPQTTITTTRATTAPARRRNANLIPVVKSMRLTYVGSPDSGRVRWECWSATSLCGTWEFERVEDEQTSWFVTHAVIGYSLNVPYGTLSAARKSIRDGSTLRLLIVQASADAGSEQCPMSVRINAARALAQLAALVEAR